MVFHTTTRRNAIIALVFIVLLVCSGLSWATRSAMRLERVEAYAVAEQSYDETRALALARLDWLLDSVLGVERSRPFDVYRSFYKPPRAYDPHDWTEFRDPILLPSPLQTLSGPDWLLLHFQASVTQGWSSPQLDIGAELAVPATAEVVEQTGVSLTIGFNRRFAQLAQELREAVKALPKPWSILYRVNAAMSGSHASKKKLVIDGGRLLGEAVHFIDFMCWLTKAEPTAVSGNILTSDRNDFSSLNNMSANLSFSDGSVATLVYTTVGGRDAGKERIEVYGGNATLILDDFLTLTGYGAAKTSVSLTEADKGHLQHLQQ